jgi:hypothetical protein
MHVEYMEDPSMVHMKSKSTWWWRQRRSSQASTEASQVGGPGVGARMTWRRQGLAGDRTSVDIEGLLVSASKPLARVWWFHPQNQRRGFTGLGLKTGGAFVVAGGELDDTWWHLRACFEAKGSREDGVTAIRSNSKKLVQKARACACIIVIA